MILVKHPWIWPQKIFAGIWIKKVLCVPKKKNN